MKIRDKNSSKRKLIDILKSDFSLSGKVLSEMKTQSGEKDIIYNIIKKTVLYYVPNEELEDFDKFKKHIEDFKKSKEKMSAEEKFREYVKDFHNNFCNLFFSKYIENSLKEKNIDCKFVINVFTDLSNNIVEKGSGILLLAPIKKRFYDHTRYFEKFLDGLKGLSKEKNSIHQFGDFIEDFTNICFDLFNLFYKVNSLIENFKNNYMAKDQIISSIISDIKCLEYIFFQKRDIDLKYYTENKSHTREFVKKQLQSVIKFIDYVGIYNHYKDKILRDFYESTLYKMYFIFLKYISENKNNSVFIVFEY